MLSVSNSKAILEDLSNFGAYPELHDKVSPSIVHTTENMLQTTAQICLELFGSPS